MEPNQMGMDNNMNQNLNMYPNINSPPPQGPPVAQPVAEPIAQPVAQPMYEPPSSTTPLMPIQPPQYGQPISTVQVQPPVVSVQPPIVVNQQNPVVVLPPQMFKSTSMVMVCPFCNRNISTSIKETFNMATCCLCLCTSPLLYICIQLCRGKDLCCYDVDHSCPYCNNRLGSYTSC